MEQNQQRAPKKARSPEEQYVRQLRHKMAPTWKRRMASCRRRAMWGCWMNRMRLACGKKLHRLTQWAKQRPEAAQMGEFFYRIGLAGEYIALRTTHSLRQVAANVGHQSVRLIAAVGSRIGGVVGSVWKDITAPLVHFAVGLRNLRVYMRQIREEEEHAALGTAKRGAGYFFRGIWRYRVVARRALAYVMPLAALGVFVYTVHTVLNYNYVLAVEVDGSVVGYVESENVFDEAKADLSQRIRDAAGTGERWDVTPRYTIAVAEETMDESAMVDAILARSGDRIQNATALYVDDNLAAVTTEGDRLRGELQAMLDEYANPDNPAVIPEFQQHVETVDGVYFTDSIDAYDSISQMLHGEVEGEVYDQVHNGDSPSQIAARNGLTTQQLYDMNGGEKAVNSKMYPGEALLVKQQVKFLTVQTVETITATRPIPFHTEEQKTDELKFGVKQTVVEGVDGLEEYTINRYTRNGIVWDEPVESHVLQEPVNAVVKVGTKLPNGSVASVGNANFMWPVPNYTYVSRWMSSGHRGTDICAPYGTPIVASDSGVVVTASYHYSWGNHVVINHGNGYTTLYGHASQLLVRPGQAVEQGQVIALVGSTGNSTGNHCHFELTRNGALFGAQQIWAPSRRPV